MNTSKVEPTAGEVHPIQKPGPLNEYHKQLLIECEDLWDTRSHWKDDIWEDVGEKIFYDFLEAAYPHEVAEEKGWGMRGDYVLDDPCCIFQAIEGFSKRICGCYQSHCAFLEYFRHFHDQWEKWVFASEREWEGLSEQERDNWTSWNDEQHASIMDGVKLNFEFIGAQPTQMSAYEKSLLSELRSHWIDRLTPELCPEGMDDEWNEDGLMTKIWRFFWDAGSTTIEECSDWRSEFDPNGYHTLEALIEGLEGDVMYRVENLRGTDGALELFQNIQELQDTYSSWVGAWEEKWDTLSENEKDEWTSWSREDHAEIMEGIDVTFGRSFKREPQVAA